MTDEVKVLTDDALREIEARHELAEAAFAPYQAVSDSLSDIPALCATVRALREQLAAASEARDQLSAALSVRDAQLVQTMQENERLLRGEFTPEEFQNLCHNTNVQEGFESFADGCEAYQQKMFGRSRAKGKVL